MIVQFEQAIDDFDGFYRPQFHLRVGAVDADLPPPPSDDDEDWLTVREHHGVVSDLTVEMTLDGADQFSFTLVDAFDLEERTFHGTAWGWFVPMAPVRVSLGYNGRFVPLLDGHIQSVQPDFPSKGLPTLQVSGFDRLHELTKQTGERDFSDVTMEQIVSSVVERYGFNDSAENLVVSLADGAEDLEFDRVQRDTDDYTFVSDRAEQFNYEFFMRIDPPEGGPVGGSDSQNRLYFRAPVDDAGRASDDTLRLEYGTSLQSLSVETNEASQVPGVVVRHTDRRRGREITATAPSNLDEETTGVKELRIAVDSIEEANLTAQAEYNKLRQERVTGRGSVVGLPTLRIGELVRLDGIGPFNNVYYVTTVTHRLGQSGYTTDFTVRLARGEDGQ